VMLFCEFNGISTSTLQGKIIFLNSVLWTEA